MDARPLLRLLICAFPALAAIGIAAETAPFAKSLYPVFEEAGCRACHNSDGVASATRLQFPEQGAPAGRIEAFGKSLVLLVDAIKRFYNSLARLMNHAWSGHHGRMGVCATASLFPKTGLGLVFSMNGRGHP